MTTRSEWKARFETFLSEVPFEKKSVSGGSLKWSPRREKIVSMYYGIGTEPQTIRQIGEYYAVTDDRIKHLLQQARRIYNRYHEAKAKNEIILARRARLAEDIKKALA